MTEGEEVKGFDWNILLYLLNIQVTALQLLLLLWSIFTLFTNTNNCLVTMIEFSEHAQRKHDAGILIWLIYNWYIYI